MNQSKPTNPAGKPGGYGWLILLAILLSIITFTPLVMPYGKHTPYLFHLPYTLWVGLIVSLVFVLLTWIAVLIHPGKKEDKS